MEKRVVLKVEEDDDRTQILATTYQMRNFYEQMGDGFFSGLDIMNYIQHETVVRMARRDDRILDMCCGRGLLLPMLRYQRKDIESYTGVDIEPRNVTYRTRRVTDRKLIPKDYYPFRVFFVSSNVAEMSSKLPNQYFDFIVYTSSIEHMHPEDGRQSLHEARAVAKLSARMYLSCPNTPEGQDGYDTHYSAHVYEWKRSELEAGLTEAGWAIEDTYGLYMSAEALKKRLNGMPKLKALYERQRKFIPGEWLIPAYAAIFPEDASEIAFVATAK